MESSRFSNGNLLCDVRISKYIWFKLVSIGNLWYWWAEMFPGEYIDILLVVPLLLFIGFVVGLFKFSNRMFGEDRGDKITTFILCTMGALGLFLAFRAAFR
jgi:hypothetical protein